MPELDLTPLRTTLAQFSPQGRTALLPALHAAQAMYGYLSEPVAAEVARALRAPLADVYGVIDFYAMFYREPVGKTIIRVCADPACALSGAEAVLDAACQKARVKPGGTSADGEYTVERAPCLGLCNCGVAVNVTRHDPSSRTSHDQSFANVTVNDLDAIFAANGQPAADYIGGDIRLLTAMCGRGRATRLAEYKQAGGMRAFEKALKSMTPQQVIAEVKASGLVGRGGAAFPTGVKWEGAANAPRAQKYFVVNADESEPGTFKDRILMEGDPCRMIEGALIGAWAIGASKVYIYIRGEYPTALERVRVAVLECKSAGYIGENILGSGFNVEVEVRSGAGAYICGEETALFESIEGNRGFPRVKPPFPTTHGLFGLPTSINNVETLVCVPYIIAGGADSFRRFGTEKSTGPKLFCVSGDVARPGLYEVPFGVTIRHLLFNLAGGVTGGGLKAILFGGAAGAFATDKDLDVKLTFEDLRAAGLPLGSGVVMAFNESRDMRDILARLAKFFAHESCGKCYPCQLGTQRQLEILERAHDGGILAGDVERLTDVGWTMTDASLCGLGQTAASAVLSAMKVWPELFENPKPQSPKSQRANAIIREKSGAKKKAPPRQATPRKPTPKQGAKKVVSKKPAARQKR
ncbi:MAG TPA: NAD(P)H-dependent oxidoreductase subunit E, partial [Anaerolineales bacterium]|nr:NAD(P)H-dependent oxidoreductase subunit E [Anaerolineales bacterium]